MKNRSPESISALGLMTAAGISLLPSGPAHALLITTNCAEANYCTPFELQYGGDFAGPGSIQVDDKLFSNWSFSTTPIPPDLLNFTVSGTGMGTEAPGLVFSGDIGEGAFSLTIQYTVTLVDDGRDDFGSWRIVDSELDLTDYTIVPDETTSEGAFYGGSIVITETSAAFSTDLEVRVEDLVVPAGTEVLMPSDSNIFSPVTSLSVITNIQLTNNFFAETELRGFEQHFSQAQVEVPEPPSAALFGIGLAALSGGMWRGRRRRVKG